MNTLIHNKKVSIIIPARNEEKSIQKTIKSYREQYDPLEIIVVVNNSVDKTCQIAKGLADKILCFPDAMTVSTARNKGGNVATGDIFIFSDADTYLTQGAIPYIAEITEKDTIGMPLGKGDGARIKDNMFFFFKNLGHTLGFYKGAPSGVFFCHRNIFFKIGGFDGNKKIAEFLDFIQRAQKAGASYKIITKYYAITSLKRYQKKGYITIFTFWITWKILSFFKSQHLLEDRYFK